MPVLKKFELTPSISILIAGVAIAGAIIFTNTRAAAPAASPTAQAPSAATNVPAPSADDHIVGSPNAPLVLIEYSDFQCPFCSVVHPTLRRLAEESNGQIAWIYRHFPLESIHPSAKPAAVASECVAEQLGNDGFWKFSDAMFANQNKIGAAYSEQVAQSIGADLAKFKSCVASNKYESKVTTQTQDAMKNGGQGTPYTILYDKKGQAGVSGALPYDTFVSVIKAFQSRQ